MQCAFVQAALDNGLLGREHAREGADVPLGLEALSPTTFLHSRSHARSKPRL